MPPNAAWNTPIPVRIFRGHVTREMLSGYGSRVQAPVVPQGHVKVTLRPLWAVAARQQPRPRRHEVVTLQLLQACASGCQYPEVPEAHCRVANLGNLPLLQRSTPLKTL